MISYRGRRAATIENDALRVTVLEEGGHIAEIADKATGINPLWTPELAVDRAVRSTMPRTDAIYGGGVDAPLLAGIMGHNLCFDIFGGPSPEEARAGLPVHGEVSTARFAIELTADAADDARPAARRRSSHSSGGSISSTAPSACGSRSRTSRPRIARSAGPST